MNHKITLTIGIVTVGLAVLGGFAISAQDKYTVRVPGRAGVLRVQGLRRMASHRLQSEREGERDDPRQSGDD